MGAQKRKEWYKQLTPSQQKTAFAMTSKEALEQYKNSLYESLCDIDKGSLDFGATPEGLDYWLNVATQVWKAETKERSERKQAALN